MLTIRLMSEADFDVVAQLDSLAFATYLEQGSAAEKLPPRTSANIRANFNLNPRGCFVAVLDENLVGYVFSRVWGKLGWLGTFGVNPECHGQGVGRRLLAAVVESLQQAGCDTVGLETAPDRPYNVGLYTSQGFWVTAPTINLIKAPISAQPDSFYRSLHDVDLNSALNAITRLSYTVQPGLDYAAEVRNAHEYQWGETLLFGWPDIWAFAIVRTESRREGEEMTTAEVTTMAVHPDAKARFGEVLQAVETLAYSRGWSKVLLPVNALDGETLQRILATGYRVHNVRLRMVYQKAYVQPVGIDISRWKM